MENEFYRCEHPVQGELNLGRGKARKARIAALFCPECGLLHAQEYVAKLTYIDGRPLDGEALQRATEKYTAEPLRRIQRVKNLAPGFSSHVVADSLTDQQIIDLCFAKEGR
jgi:hypothetical protein